MKRFVLAVVRHLFRREKRIQAEAEFLGYEAFSQSTAAALKTLQPAHPKEELLQKKGRPGDFHAALRKTVCKK